MLVYLRIDYTYLAGMSLQETKFLAHGAVNVELLMQRKSVYNFKFLFQNCPNLENYFFIDFLNFDL